MAKKARKPPVLSYLRRAERGGALDWLQGDTVAGERFGRLREGDPGSNHLSEFAGPTFAPDGNTIFVNTQKPGITFAIWGPFNRRNSGAQRQRATAAPPAHLAPRISGELAEAAENYGMGLLEAAAFDRLGIPLA